MTIFFQHGGRAICQINADGIMHVCWAKETIYGKKRLGHARKTHISVFKISCHNFPLFRPKRP